MFSCYPWHFIYLVSGTSKWHYLFTKVTEKSWRVTNVSVFICAYFQGQFRCLFWKIRRFYPPSCDCLNRNGVTVELEIFSTNSFHCSFLFDLKSQWQSIHSKIIMFSIREVAEPMSSGHLGVRKEHNINMWTPPFTLK